MRSWFYYINLITIFLLNVEFYSQGRWESITSPTDKPLRSVFFVDSLYGWAAGDSGTIIQTTDGGNNWNIQNINSLDKVVDIFFLNRNSGWAISWSVDSFPFKTIIQSTTNGGLIWLSNPYREDEILMNCILFLDSLNGWMGGTPHALVKTTDGGILWEQAAIDSANLAFFPVLNIKFYNSMYGYACGGKIDVVGVTWRTSNGGDMWFPIRAVDAPAEPVNELHIFDSLNVIGVSGGVEPMFPIDIIKTSDGGVSWKYESLIYNGNPSDLDFRSDTEVWIPVINDKAFIVSNDAGLNWLLVATPDTTAIYNMTFPDSLHGFAVGEGGVILKYFPPIINFAEDLELTVSTNFLLEQNYPNPFNSSSKIKFSIPQRTSSIHSVGNVEDIVFVTLKVYDIMGNEIETLITGEYSSGYYNVIFNANELSSGIYFYRITISNKQQELYASSNKMILLK